MHVIVHAHAGLARAEAWRRRSWPPAASADALACDLTDVAGDRARALAACWRRAGRSQILVHNAGTHDDAPMAGMSEAQWRGVIDVSLHGFYASLQPLLLPMMATRWGRIIAIASVVRHDRQSRPGQLRRGQGRADRRGEVALARDMPAAA